MSDALILEAVYVVNPRTFARAQRLACALTMLRGGVTRREATVLIQSRFSCSQPAAWRVVDIAADMTLVEVEK